MVSMERLRRLRVFMGKNLRLRWKDTAESVVPLGRLDAFVGKTPPTSYFHVIDVVGWKDSLGVSRVRRYQTVSYSRFL